MKTIKKVLLFTLLFLAYVIFSSDVIPNNYHPVEKCLKISNLSEFPDYSLIAYITGPTLHNYQTFIIKSDSCIYKGYKFNTIKFFAIKNSLLEKYHLSDIPFDKLAKNIVPVVIEETSEEPVADENDLQSIESIYKIQAITNSTMILYKSEQVEFHSKGQTEVHTIYKKPNL